MDSVYDRFLSWESQTRGHRMVMDQLGQEPSLSEESGRRLHVSLDGQRHSGRYCSRLRSHVSQKLRAATGKSKQ